ncbi:transcriptional regulator [Pasteurellaceae bacterium Macca]|nr:transcriptional regulator [Pasteurellaceae bacterium Macca]
MHSKEQLSAFMDGEHESQDFAATLCKNPELQRQWASYHVARSVMRGEEQLLDQNFSLKMAELLEQEPLPQSQKPKGLLLKLKGWSMPIMQAGIAASVCLVAVVGVNMFNNNDEVASTEQPVLQTLPFTNTVQQVSYNAPSQVQPTQAQLEYQQNRINALLQNHELQRRTQITGVTQSHEEKTKAQSSATQHPSQQ